MTNKGLSRICINGLDIPLSVVREFDIQTSYDLLEVPPSILDDPSGAKDYVQGLATENIILALLMTKYEFYTSRTQNDPLMQILSELDEVVFTGHTLWLDMWTAEEAHIKRKVVCVSANQTYEGNWTRIDMRFRPVSSEHNATRAGYERVSAVYPKKKSSKVLFD